MWGKKLKKRKAVDRWHTKAMLVDPKKVKITMLWTAEPEISGSVEGSGIQADNLEIVEPSVTDEVNTQVAGDSIGALGSNFAAAGSFMPLEVDLLTLNSGDADAPEVCLDAENLEADVPSFEASGSILLDGQGTVDSSSEFGSALPMVGAIELESIPVDSGVVITPEEAESSGNRGATAPNLESQVINAVEPEKVCEAAGALEAAEPEVAEDLTAVGSPEEKKVAESVEPEAADVAASNDCFDDVVSEGKEPLNVQFLKALERTRSMWDSDDQFAKIVQKLQKGKKLKRKEFEKVYLHIHTYCRYH
jgi:hypothetical protein